MANPSLEARIGPLCCVAVSVLCYLIVALFGEHSRSYALHSSGNKYVGHVVGDESGGSNGRISKRAHTSYGPSSTTTTTTNNINIGPDTGTTSAIVVAAAADGPLLSSKQQPPGELVFSNQTGASAQCGVALELARAISAAQVTGGGGQSDIVIRWEKDNGDELEPAIYANSAAATTLSNEQNAAAAVAAVQSPLRWIRQTDGALVFEPFRAHDFRPEVHAATYRCMASSAARGASLVSRDMRVRAVVASGAQQQQQPAIEVLDELALEGNSAVFRCQVPGHALDYLRVLDWTEYPSERQLSYQSTTQANAAHLFSSASGQTNNNDDNNSNNNHSSSATSRYFVAPKTGDLHIINVDATFNYRSYKCRCQNKLTGELVSSINKGKLIVTESLPPRLVAEPPVSSSATVGGGRPLLVHNEGELALLSCNIQSSPRAHITWLRRRRLQPGASAGADQWTPVPLVGGRDSQKSANFVQVANLLLIQRVQRNDSGAYLCQARNALDEERVELELAVRSRLRVSLRASSNVLELGKSLVLDCQVSGYPIGQVIFRHNRNVIKSVAGESSMQQQQQQLQQNAANNYFVIDGTNNAQSTVASDQVETAPGEEQQMQAAKLSHVIVIVLEPQHAGAYQCHAENQYESAQASTYIRVLDDPPKFKETFASELYEQRQDVSLLCSARANPLPEITWSVDEQPIPESARTRFGDFVTKDNLVISYVNISGTQVTDSGLYRCTADNGLAQISHQAQISVAGPLQVKPMANATVVAGTTFRVRCPVAGHPLADIQWQHNGRRLPANHRQHVQPENGTLVVEHMEKSQNDEGEYTCVASGPPLPPSGTNSNSLQQQQQQQVATGSLHVSIKVRPTIEPFSVSRSLREGQRASITCTISSGDLPIPISWFRNDQLLVFPNANANSNSPDLPAVATTDLVAASVGGQLHHHHHQQQQQQQQQHHPREITLPDVRISRGSDYSSTLLFESLLVEHSANYTCLARNEAGSSSHQAPMVVQVAPKWSLEPGDTNVVRGSSMSIDCMATGFPPPRIIWTKAADSNQVREQTSASSSSPTSSSKQMVVHPTGTWVYENGSLNILDARDSDFGYYMCQASNGVGPGLSKVIRVTINVAAQFSTRHSVQYVTRGEASQLKCLAKGDAPLVIHWFKNKNYLEPVNTQDAAGVQQASVLMLGASGGGSGSGSFHSLAQLQQQQHHQHQHHNSRMLTGTTSSYTLIERVGALIAASQSAGGVKQQGLLLDRYTLSTSEQLSSASKLAAGSKHHPPVVVQLESVLAISQVERQDTGTHKCLAVNNFGLDERTIQLVVQESPDRIEELSALEQSSRSVTLAWLAPYDGNSPITQFHVQYKAAGSDNNDNWTNYTLVAGQYSNHSVLMAEQQHLLASNSGGGNNNNNKQHQTGRNLIKLTINLLRPITRYWFRVAAENKLGTGPMSVPVETVTAEEAPGAAPGKLRAAALSSSSIQVSWWRLSDRDTVGSVHGYYVAYRQLGEDLQSQSSANSSKSTANQQQQQHQHQLQQPTNIYKTVQHDDKQSKFEALLTGLRRSTKYLISVQAFNGRGTGPASEPVVVRTLEMDPPRQVRLYVKQATNCSIQLEWRPLSQAAILHQQLMLQSPTATRAQATDTGDQQVPKSNQLPLAMAQQQQQQQQSARQEQHIPSVQLAAGDQLDIVDYYTLNLAESSSDQRPAQWQELRLPGHASSHLIEGLRCGTKYQVLMSGVNRIGQGEQSDRLEARTMGELPRAPDRRLSFDVINTTCYIVRLDHWDDMGCPISEFSVRYRAETARDWTQSAQFKLGEATGSNLSPLQNEDSADAAAAGGDQAQNLPQVDSWRYSGARLKRETSSISGGGEDTYLYSGLTGDERGDFDDDSLMDYNFGGESSIGELGDYVSNVNDDLVQQSADVSLGIPFDNSSSTLLRLDDIQPVQRQQQPAPNLQLMNLLEDSMTQPSFAPIDTVASVDPSFVAKLPPVAQQWQASNFVETTNPRQSKRQPGEVASALRFTPANDWRRVRLCNLVENTYYTVQIRAVNQVGPMEAELRLLTAKEGLEYDDEVKRQVVGRLDADGRLGQLVSGGSNGGRGSFSMLAIDQWPVVLPVMLTITLMTVIMIVAFLLKRSHSGGSTTTTTTTTTTSAGSANRCQNYAMNHDQGFKGLGAASAITEATIGSDLLTTNGSALGSGGAYAMTGQNGPSVLLDESFSSNNAGPLSIYHQQQQQQQQQHQSMFDEPAYGVVAPLNHHLLSSVGGANSINDTTNRSSCSPATTTAATASLNSASTGCGRGVFLCANTAAAGPVPKDLESPNQQVKMGESATIYYGRTQNSSGIYQGHQTIQVRHYQPQQAAAEDESPIKSLYHHASNQIYQQQQQQQQCNSVQTATELLTNQFQQCANGGNYATVTSQQVFGQSAGRDEFVGKQSGDLTAPNGQQAANNRMMFDPVYATIRRTFPQAFKYLTLQQQHHGHQQQQQQNQYLIAQQRQQNDAQVNDNQYIQALTNYNNQRHSLNDAADELTSSSIGQTFDNSNNNNNEDQQNLFSGQQQLQQQQHNAINHQNIPVFNSSNLAALNLLIPSTNPVIQRQ